MSYTLYNNNNLMDEISNFRDKYLKEYRVKNTNISIRKKQNSTFGKTYRKFMIPIYKLTRGNLNTIFGLN